MNEWIIQSVAANRFLSKVLLKYLLPPKNPPSSQLLGFSCNLFSLLTVCRGQSPASGLIDFFCSENKNSWPVMMSFIPLMLLKRSWLRAFVPVEPLRRPLSTSRPFSPSAFEPRGGALHLPAQSARGPCAQNGPAWVLIELHRVWFREFRWKSTSLSKFSWSKKRKEKKMLSWLWAVIFNYLNNVRQI